MTNLTLSRYLQQQQEQHGVSPELCELIRQTCDACHRISDAIGKGALAGVLGHAGSENVQGEEQKKLDIISNDLMIAATLGGGCVAGLASEEMDEILPVPDGMKEGRYLLLFDPLDGSSNIDVNVSIGTIFAIYRCIDWTNRGRLEDCLQPGRKLVAAGYVLYGSSTMLVYSTGHGVHGFTLDPELGEFLLSHENMKLPEPPQFYSVNHAYYRHWSPTVQKYVRWLQGLEPESPPKPLSERYIGSMVADFHRNLLRGGVFLYPAETGKPQGKIRLLYEAAPLSFLVEQAGGYGSTGCGSILDVIPVELHQRTPFFIGNRALVEKAEEMLANE